MYDFNNPKVRDSMIKIIISFIIAYIAVGLTPDFLLAILLTFTINRYI